MITFIIGSSERPVQGTTQLFRARGSAHAGEGRAEQVDLNAASLCSDDAFLLTKPGYAALWFGKVCHKYFFLQYIDLSCTISV